MLYTIDVCNIDDQTLANLIESRSLQGMSVDDLCTDLNITPSKYKFLKRKYNIKSLRSKDLIKESWRQIIEMYNETDLSPLEISRELNISHCRVYRCLKKHGILVDVSRTVKSRKKTIKERYGTDNITAEKWVLDKRKQTWQEKYNANAPLGNPEIKRKA